MQIGRLNTDDQVIVIAEIGNNHEGDINVAGELIREAAKAGADVVKFQTIVPERLVSSADSARVKQLQRFQLTAEQFGGLREVAEDHGLLFLSTPFDPNAVDWLNRLVPAWKIASGDNDFFPLLDRVASTGKPLIVSMGLGQARNGRELVSFVQDASRRHGVAFPGIALLHCRVSYPTPLSEAGLSAITELARSGATVGYSDHTVGIRAAELAVAAGARIIEKHFTLDKNYSEFRDHQLSADPDDLARLVDGVREIEGMFSDSEASEMQNEEAVRRSIAAVDSLPVGHVIQQSDLCWVRPRSGMVPGQESLLCGKRLNTAVSAGEAFQRHFVD